MDILSLDTPAWTNRSMTFASTPQVMGLMKPSGGGDMNEALILSNCETKVGSPGIQLPMTMRPPGFVTRTISLATSKGFGAMFAPKPFDVAKEMVRVTKPGGRIVMGNWIPGDPTFVSQLLKISTSFMPPPPEGFISPVTWGVEANAIERFVQAGVSSDKISLVKDTYQFISPDKTPADFIDLFERFYGPTMNAVEAAQKTGRIGDLHTQLVQLANAQNRSTDGGTLIHATFLRVTVHV